jgi:hypothetical protein
MSLTLTIAQLRLDGPIPYVDLDVADEKNRQGNDIVIRDDLAADLRAWLTDKLAALQAEAHRRGEPIPSRLPGGIPVFAIPDGLVRIFDRDLKLAGIAKRDERGRTLDVHALKMTFGTHLGKRGGAIANDSSRHSAFRPQAHSERLYRSKALGRSGYSRRLAEPTAQRGGPTPERERARATGTDAPGPGAVAPVVALNHGNERQTLFIDDKPTSGLPNSIGPARHAVNQAISRDFTVPIGLATGGSSVCPAGFEPETSSSGGYVSICA